MPLKPEVLKDKACAVCDDTFTPKNKRQIHCSRQCRQYRYTSSLVSIKYEDLVEILKYFVPSSPSDWAVENTEDILEQYPKFNIALQEACSNPVQDDPND